MVRGVVVLLVIWGFFQKARIQKKKEYQFSHLVEFQNFKLLFQHKNS